MSEKFYSGTYCVRVLSDRPQGEVSGPRSLRDLLDEAYSGDMVGDLVSANEVEVTPGAMAELLTQAGSEPGFFGIDEDVAEVVEEPDGYTEFPDIYALEGDWGVAVVPSEDPHWVLVDDDEEDCDVSFTAVLFLEDGKCTPSALAAAAGFYAAFDLDMIAGSVKAVAWRKNVFVWQTKDMDPGQRTYIQRDIHAR